MQISSLTTNRKRVPYEFKCANGNIRTYYFEAGAGYMGAAQKELYKVHCSRYRLYRQLAATAFPEGEAAIINDPARIEATIGPDGANVETYMVPEP